MNKSSLDRGFGRCIVMKKYVMFTFMLLALVFKLYVLCTFHFKTVLLAFSCFKVLIVSYIWWFHLNRYTAINQKYGNNTSDRILRPDRMGPGAERMQVTHKNTLLVFYHLTLGDFYMFFSLSLISLNTLFLHNRRFFAEYIPLFRADIGWWWNCCSWGNY